MHKQNYTLCCKNTCCKQGNSQWKNFVGCKNYNKDTRNRTYAGPPKGFVQNLKDKIVNLQDESMQLQFVKKPVKKKQKDYYCLMLRKINNLDKKLQNLENLFVSHLNHTPNEVFNSNNTEPLYNYMDFYDSVRSLVDLANSLKEDILHKQGSNNTPHRNVLHINDRIQVLDSELQNLYTYLDQLQNYASEIKDAKQYFAAEDYQNVQYNHPVFRGSPKIDNIKYVGFNGIQKSNKNQRKKPQKCNENNYSVGHPSPHCMECYDCDEYSPAECQCSMCNVHATFMSPPPPGNRRCSPKRFDHCHVGPTANNSDCSCDLCANERKKKFQPRKNNVWVSQSTSSCSCEICVSNNNNKKPFNKNCNGARIKIIKPVRKGLNEENLLSELQISYHEMGPSIQGKKKKKESKRGNKDIELETVYYQDIGPESRANESIIVSNIKSEDSINLEQNQGKITKNKYSKTVSASKNQEIGMKNLVYYELAPDLNIITKRKNNKQVFYTTDQKIYQQRNKSNKKNKNKSKDEEQRNVTYRIHTENFDYTEEESPNKFSKKTINNTNTRSSSEKENLSNFYQSNGLEQKNTAKPTGSTEKHLHIKFRKKNEFKESITVEQSMKKSPEYEYNYTNKRAQPQHRHHGGLCHFQNPTGRKKNRANKRFPYSYYSEVSESDSFETVEENESDYDSCSQYKLYICNDPNCVDKLNSDELIMLMNRTDLKSCGENLYQLNVSESVADLKSDICEKCTIKEKTISVVPRKTKNQNNNEKGKIVIKKEMVKCFNCRNKDSEDSSETIKSDGSFGLEKNERTRINKSGSNVKSPYKDEINSNGSKNKKEKKQKNKRDPGSSSSSKIAENSKITNNPENKGTHNKDITVAHNLDQGGSVVMLRGNEELQGYGNMININIDRGSYSWNQQPGIGQGRTSSTNKNKNLELITDYAIDSVPTRPLLTDNIQEDPSITNDVTSNSFRNKLNGPKTHTFHSESIKSRSTLDVTKNSEKEIKGVTNVKSEIFEKAVHNSIIKDDMKNHSNNNKLPLYGTQVSSGLGDIKEGKRLSKKDIVKKQISFNYDTEKNPGNVIIDITNSRYIYDRSSKTQTIPRKKGINGVSSTRLKRSRLKFNKNFGSCLSKVPSVNSVVVQHARICQDDERRFKKPSYSQGRRSYKLLKHKKNTCPRISSLSGIIKPQGKIIEQANYQNDFKIPPNDCSNSRYKIASISNYLSSTVDTESSYSSVNWEKVAKKLKEDTYYKNIA